MLSNNLKKIRKEFNITQKDLAKILGFQKSTISFYESGDRKPDYETLLKIADHFNVSVDWLLGRSSERATVDEIKKEKQYEIEEILYKFPVYFEGEVLTNEDKDSIISLLHMLRNRVKKKNI